MYHVSRIFSSILLFGLLATAGCTNKMSDVNDTISALYDSHQDIELNQEKITELPYPSAYVRLNDGKQIFMVLAFADTNPETKISRLSWISSDRALIITEQGRIVKTVGLEQDNLAEMSSHHTITPVQNQQAWQSEYHWMPDYRFKFSAVITPSFIGEAQISSSQWALNTKHYQERIEFPSLETNIVNQYWLASDNQVMKTIQYLGPDMTKIEMTVLKTYAAN